MNENVEIERRFLVDGRNDKPWQGGEYIKIQQYYLSEVTHENGEVAWRNQMLVSSWATTFSSSAMAISKFISEMGVLAISFAPSRQ